MLATLQRQEATQHARAAQEARHQLQQFLGMVSHDLAQPLTAIQGSAQLLSRQADRMDPERRQRVQAAIDAAVQQMHRLIGDLKDAAHIGRGHFTIWPARMDLVVLLRAVITEQQVTTSRHHLRLEAPEQVEGTWDRDRLHQLFTNLIANTIKYSPEGGEVCITEQHTPQEVLISVADRGLGMTPEQRAVLFQPFTRLNHANAVPGSGLDLYISKAIVDAHEGHIWVESEAGQGTTVSVALPPWRAADYIRTSPMLHRTLPWCGGKTHPPCSRNERFWNTVASDGAKCYHQQLAKVLERTMVSERPEGWVLS